MACKVSFHNNRLSPLYAHSVDGDCSIASKFNEATNARRSLGVINKSGFLPDDDNDDVNDDDVNGFLFCSWGVKRTMEGSRLLSGRSEDLLERSVHVVAGFDVVTLWHDGWMVVGPEDEDKVDKSGRRRSRRLEVDGDRVAMSSSRRRRLSSFWMPSRILEEVQRGGDRDDPTTPMSDRSRSLGTRRLDRDVGELEIRRRDGDNFEFA